ncbi:MAG: hypothetical protein IJV39_02215 [Ruminococcus sp.]|nr:hypothetical protein [Ruminococcus sp.]
MKKVISLTTVLALIVCMLSVLPSAGAVSENPVKLIYAKSAYTVGGIGAKGYVEVENIAYEKSVTIHYSFNGTDWYDTAAEYYQPTHGNYEAWKFETTGIERPGHDSAVVIQFAIKYEVNGSTYWDNNDGQNYSVYSGYHAPDFYDIGVGGIVDYHSSRTDNTVSGAVQLKNLGYEKDVKVIYTTDNWETSNTADAEYDYTSYFKNYIETWKYSFTVDSENEIQYKLSYTVNGTTYIDDNFGDYYTV